MSFCKQLLDVVIKHLKIQTSISYLWNNKKKLNIMKDFSIFNDVKYLLDISFNFPMFDKNHLTTVVKKHLLIILF